METVFYDKKYRQAFIDLNLAWIEKYFVVEPQDVAILEGVDKAVADGAGVFFVLEDGVPISTCMDLPKGGGVWEICKLAADEAHRGKGAGEAVLRACMEHAAANGAKKTHDSVQQRSRRGDGTVCKGGIQGSTRRQFRIRKSQYSVRTRTVNNFGGIPILRRSAKCRAAVS